LISVVATCCGAPLRRWWAHGGSGGWGRLVLAPEFLQQRFRLLQVGGVKALGEPAVDRRQQRAGFSVLVLLLPEARQARGCAQLQRPRFLVAGNVEGLLKTRLGAVLLATPLG